MDVHRRYAGNPQAIRWKSIGGHHLESHRNYMYRKYPKTTGHTSVKYKITYGGHLQDIHWRCIGNTLDMHSEQFETHRLTLEMHETHSEYPQDTCWKYIGHTLDSHRKHNEHVSGEHTHWTSTGHIFKTIFEYARGTPQTSIGHILEMHRTHVGNAQDVLWRSIGLHCKCKGKQYSGNPQTIR